MKQTIKVLLCWAVIFLCLAQGNAQTLTRISANKDTLPSSAKTYVANVKVAGFKKIIGASFAVAWDSAVISFDSIGNFGLPLSKNDHFGYLNTKNGVLRFLWQEGISGVTLKDNTTLFSIYFKVIGKPGSKSPISFVGIAESPTLEKEIIDTTFSTINADYINGVVVIKSQTSATVFASDPNKLRVNRAYPNPFNANLTLEFTLQEAGKLDIEVVDVLGKVVHTEKRSYLAGKQELLLPKSVFPSPGNYFVRMYQGTSFTLQPVIFMQ
jgi:Secretion system C-terminal sorting domain/Cohesin domain